ncbi:MAG: phosphoglucomutase/phosphomannomutase family protein [candidate division NC10 bacterium]|nr:phosphoglucomutase/phosphomannomutase family protein [candidate division NC10 bacterium]MDE2321176.1 phosphoglucomutase/phosphomannomutase family protein [candidate division NC10 bacterium]
MKPIRFGTSGWRDIIADTFTFANVRLVARAIAEHLLAEGIDQPYVVVGYDTRFLSEAFAAETAAVLAAHGVRVWLTDRDVPTPVVAYEVIRRGAAGGLNITASHNPSEYNGLKFSGPSGGPVLPAVTDRIEKRVQGLLAQPETPCPPLGELEAKGLVVRIDPRPTYLNRLRELVDLHTIAAARLKVAVDLLYGTAGGYLDEILREAGCDVQILHGSRNPAFGGMAPDPSEANLRELAAFVRSGGFQLGLATDGDADRYGIIDRDGRFIEPNYILALLLRHLITTRGWRTGVARSVATSHLVDAVARPQAVPVYETKVGFKYLGELITQGKVALCGEESAGLSILGHVPEKDGILAALLVTEMVAMAGGTGVQGLLDALYAEVGGAIYARRLNLHLTPEQQGRLADRLKELPTRVAGLAVVEVNRLDGTKLLLEDGSWFLVRSSGTEPVVRLYLDAHSEAQIEELTAAARALLDV